jgi:hypothetical protein
MLAQQCSNRRRPTGIRHEGHVEVGRACALAIGDTAGSAAAPVAKYRNCLRWGSFTVPSNSGDVSHALNAHDTQPEPWSVCELLSPAVGTSAAIANEEGFGTLSRQLGNDGGYRSSRVDVSGCFTRTWSRWRQPQQRSEGQGREKRHRDRGLRSYRLLRLTGSPRRPSPTAFPGW